MNFSDKIQQLRARILLPSLDVLAILMWGALLLKYRLTGQLQLLIHPNYFSLVLIAAIVLLLIGISKAWRLYSDWQNRATQSDPQEFLGHISLFPTGWGSSLLLLVALFGFLFSPTVLTSKMALQRGVTESLPATEIQPQAFRTQLNTESRSLIEWVRTLSAYPEPDAYAGQPAKVTGFVIHFDQLPEDIILLSRFIITCCAVDASPVGILVRLPPNQTDFPADTWLEVAGKMTVESLPANFQSSFQTQELTRQLVLAAESVKKIPIPANPYEES